MSNLTCPAGRKLMERGSFKPEVGPFCADEDRIPWFTEEVPTLHVEYKNGFKFRVSGDLEVLKRRAAQFKEKVNVAKADILNEEMKKPISFDEALAYCQSHRGTLPTNDQLEIIFRGTDGDSWLAYRKINWLGEYGFSEPGHAPFLFVSGGYIHCSHYIVGHCYSMPLTGHFTSEGVEVGSGTDGPYEDIGFRCVSDPKTP